MRTTGVVFVITIAVALPGHAQESVSRVPDEERPAVGLVLGGGGARGGAHIGVLKVLEEMRVPVDYVVGTSMGSIVGALYSVGMSPDEMEKALQDVEWEALFSDRPQRRRISFRRKQDDDLALFPFEIGVGKRGMSMKSGIIAGSKIDFLFRTLTLEAAAVPDFDDLRVPFRAVAADLETGAPIVLDHGDLATAMRASMSIPGVFMPVEIDGHILVDGGIALNLPVDVARGLGAKRIIAIDVGTPPKSSARGLSTAGVISQMISVMSQQNVDQQRARVGAGDVLITPDLKDVSTADFSKIDIAIAAGVAAARQHEAELRAFAVSEEAYRKALQRQRHESARPFQEVPIGTVRVERVGRDGTRATSESLSRRLQTRAGRTLDVRLLADDLARMTQAGEFESVDFRIVPDQSSANLVIEAVQKSWGPGYLRFGLGVESDVEGNSEFRALINYRRPELNRLGAEWNSTLSFGNPASIDTEFYQPLESSGFWFVAPRLGYKRDRQDTFLSDETFESVDARRAFAGLDFGVQFRNYGEVRLGVLRGKLRLETATTSTFPSAEPDLGGARVRFTLDQIDNVFFPTHGNQTRFEWFSSRQSLGADDEYERLTGATLQAWSLGRGTVLGSLELDTDLGSNLPLYDRFELGGFLNLSGLARGRFRGDVKFLGRLINYWRIGKPNPIARSYLGIGLEAGNVWEDAAQAGLEDLRYSGVAFWGLDTKLSPVYFAYGFAEGGESSLYVFIGLPFRGP